MNNDAISRSALLSFPIRGNHYDKENGDAHFICGIETVMEYAETLPRLNIAPEWISVDDSLPDDMESVLAFVCAGNSSWYDITWRYRGTWRNYECCIDGVITYWMPLPEPPGGQEVCS